MLVYAMIDLLPQALIVFGVAFLHEMAHVFVAINEGYHVIEIEVMPFGGVAKIDNMLGCDVHSEFNIAIAGPLNNLALMGVGWLMQYCHVWNPDLTFFFIKVNLFMALFNFIPALPLDGGRIYRSLLARKIGFKKASEKAFGMSRFISVILMIGGSIGFYLGYVNALVIVIAIFLFGASNQEKQMTLYVIMKNYTKKKEDLLKKGIISGEQLVVLETTPVGEVINYALPQKYHTFVIMNHHWEIAGMITESQVVDILMEKGISITMKQILYQNKVKFLD